MVNRLAEAERAVKMTSKPMASMNQSPASSVLANLGGGELPPHLRGDVETHQYQRSWRALLEATSNDQRVKPFAPNLGGCRPPRRPKAGVAVEAPNKLTDDMFDVNITMSTMDVLDTPEDLTKPLTCHSNRTC